MEASIIITAYNYARYLDECIQSCLKQTVSAEIIVVDDESTDNTREIVAQYPVKYIWQKNKGLSGARNTGIKEATGKYIMCLDADDILRPDAVKEHLKLMDENTIGQCALMWFGNQTGTWYPQGATYESMRRANSVFCNAMFSKKKWDEVGGFDESETMRLGWEDYLYWFELIKNGCTVKTSNYVALLYRKHGKNMTETQTHPNIPKIKAYMKAKHSDLLF
jgi:glycosyltransferase involved in cell wall biosynthesis